MNRQSVTVFFLGGGGGGGGTTSAKLYPADNTSPPRQVLPHAEHFNPSIRMHTAIHEAASCVTMLISCVHECTDSLLV